MDCQQARAAMEAWLAESLDSGRERALRRHVAGCPDCRACWTEIRRSLTVLQSAAAVAPRDPPSLWPRVACRIRHTRCAETDAPVWHFWAAAGLATTVLLLVVAFAHPDASHIGGAQGVESASVGGAESAATVSATGQAAEHPAAESPWTPQWTPQWTPDVSDIIPTVDGAAPPEPLQRQSFPWPQVPKDGPHAPP